MYIIVHDYRSVHIDKDKIKWCEKDYCTYSTCKLCSIIMVYDFFLCMNSMMAFLHSSESHLSSSSSHSTTFTSSSFSL